MNDRQRYYYGKHLHSTMVHYSKWLLCVFIIYIFSSCDPCGNLDCASGKASVGLRFVNASTGKNLLFGADKLYDTSRVKFFSARGTDTSYFNYYIALNANRPGDTALLVDFFPVVDTAYVRLNRSDIDTLIFSFKNYRTKCCGNLTDIVSVRYNDISFSTTTLELQEIRK